MDMLNQKTGLILKENLQNQVAQSEPKFVNDYLFFTVFDKFCI